MNLLKLRKDLLENVSTINSNNDIIISTINSNNGVIISTINSNNGVIISTINSNNDMLLVLLIVTVLLFQVRLNIFL